MNAAPTIALALEWPLCLPALASHEARIYRTSISALEPHHERLSSLLSDDEVQRALAYRLSAPRRRFELVRGALRSLLSAFLGCGAREVAIERNAEGKPQLRAAAEPPLHFNVSHSRDMALFALSSAAPVGVDIEYIDQSIDAEVVMQTAFSDAERAACRAAGEGDALAEFFRIWTRKEARIKASGLAMAHRFFASADRLPVVDLHLSDEYAGALAVCGDHAQAHSLVFFNICHNKRACHDTRS
jgi:4'-phosphopantetheinyl transferase